jgi:thymidylate synthase ThyX
MYEARVIEDSISIAGARLTTFQLKYPRYIHAEFMTHRVFSRNASSSRAIPVNKLVQKSLDEMVFPIRWGLNQPGMQANEQELEGERLEKAKLIWKRMAEFCANGVLELADLGLHKQWANRPLEWFGHIEVVVTATEWENFYHLRDHKDAQPEIRELAQLMRKAQNESQPKLRIGLNEDDPYSWHLPYVTAEERAQHSVADLVRMSTARNARVSYLTHDKKEPDVELDIALHERLVGGEPIHASPTEHVAFPFAHASEWSANFKGWHQYRKDIEETFN